jgi:hypothetical protein
MDDHIDCDDFSCSMNDDVTVCGEGSSSDGGSSDGGSSDGGSSSTSK